VPENYIFLPTVRNKMSNRSRVHGSEVGLFVSSDLPRQCRVTARGERMRIERFEDIEPWQLARELTQKVYGLTKKAKFARD